MVGKGKSTPPTPGKKPGFQMKLKPSAAADKTKSSAQKKTPAAKTKLPPKSPGRVVSPEIVEESSDSELSGSDSDQTEKIDHPVTKAKTKSPLKAKPGTPVQSSQRQSPRKRPEPEASSGSETGSESDDEESSPSKTSGVIGQKKERTPVKTKTKSSPARAPVISSPVRREEESESGSESDDSSKALSFRKPLQSGQGFHVRDRANSKSPRKDLTATLNNIKAKSPLRKPPPPSAEESDDDESDTSYDSAEEHQETPVEALNKTLSKSPLSPKSEAGKGDVDEDILEGSRIVLQMTEDDLKQLADRVECACQVLDRNPFSKGVKLIKWGDIAFGQYDADACRKAWLYLQHKRRVRRNLWEVVHEIKYSLDHDAVKFRKDVILHSPEYPKRPPGASGGLNMYSHVLLTELKEKDPSKLNYLEWYKGTTEKYQLLPESEKKEWQAKSDALKEKFKKEIADFEAQHRGFLPGKVRKKTGRVRGTTAARSSPARVRAKSVPRDPYPDAPKPPSNPMETYIQTALSKMDPPPLPEEVDELRLKYGNKWHQLDDSKKAKTIGRVLKKVEEYFREVEEYKRTHPGYKTPKSHRVSHFVTAAELSLWESTMGRPQKPPATVNEMFYKELESKGELNQYDTEIDKKAAADQKFSSLSFYEKEMYKLQHKQVELKYMKDIAEYVNNVPEYLRPTILANIEKKYKHEIVKVDQGGGEGTDDSTKSPAKKKRKAQKEDEQEPAGPSKKAKKGKASSAVDEEVTTNHVMNEIKEAKETLNDSLVEQREEDESQKKKKKKKKKSELYDVIRGIFDARQDLGRRYSVFYYYARYVMKTNPMWQDRLEDLGLCETAELILQALTQLSDIQKQVFINYSRNFHAEMYQGLKIEEDGAITEHDSKERVFFPGEPRAPPRHPQVIYYAEMKAKGRQGYPHWTHLDRKTRRLYHKKLYRLTQEYAEKFQDFVDKMTINDLIEYTVAKSERWEKLWNTSVHVQRAAKGFTYPLPTHDYFEDDDDYVTPETVPLNEIRQHQVAPSLFDNSQFLTQVLEHVETPAELLPAAERPNTVEGSGGDVECEGSCSVEDAEEEADAFGARKPKKKRHKVDMEVLSGLVDLTDKAVQRSLFKIK